MSSIDLEARKTGIGGSDVAAVLGLSKWKTPYDLWLEKTGKAVIDDDDKKAELFHWGHTLEEVVAQEFSRQTGFKVQRRNAMFRHPEHPELIGNIDRYIVGGGVLECKTADRFTAHLWGEDESDKVPAYYLTQLMHYLHVTGNKFGYLAVLIGGNEFRKFRVEYDNELAEVIADKCLEFWRDNVIANVAPAAVTAADLAKMYRSVDGKVITGGQDMANACVELRTLKDQKKNIEGMIDDRELVIKTFMTDSEVLLGPDGKKLVTWKTGSRETIDTKAFKAACPDLAAQFARVAETRTFLLK